MAWRIARSERALTAPNKASASSRFLASRNSTKRRAMMVLAASCASKSPTTMSGTRTFSRMMRNKSSFGLPALNSLMIGSRKPSSNTSLQSADNRRPPTSGRVGDTHGVGDDAAAMKDRRHEEDVVDLACADPRIGGDQAIARIGASPAERPPGNRAGPAPCSRERRQPVPALRDHLTLRVKQRAAEVPGFGDDARECGAQQRDLRLIDDGKELVPPHGQRGDVERRRVFRGHTLSFQRDHQHAADRRLARAPGGTTLVDSWSSTMAGPSSAAPGAQGGCARRAHQADGSRCAGKHHAALPFGFAGAASLSPWLGHSDVQLGAAARTR